MPQLEFTWWVVNFFLIWISVIVVVSVISANITTVSEEVPSSATSISKNSTEWQWS